MGVEMSANRLLSPYFGSTNFIWTVIISLIMVGLGLGSYVGGRLADRYHSGPLLYGIIAGSAIWIALLPVTSRYVIEASLWVTRGMASGAFLVSAILSSVVLFVPPLILLGTISPYLAKLCVKDLSETGSVLGRLSVLNTVGSIVGSILPAFVLIPTIGVKRSFLLFAAILLALCVWYWLSDRADRRRGLKSALVCVPLALAMGLTSPGIAFTKPLYETDSMYQYLKVDRQDGITTLSSGLYNLFQTVQADDPEVLLGIYTDSLAALPALFPSTEPVRILQIGYGGGVVARQLKHYYENVDLTCVELDAEVVAIAIEYFGADPADRVIVDDGRAFLQRSEEAYDIIIVDAYQDTGIPLNLLTREFFQQCRDHLREGGMMAMNVSAGMEPDAPFSLSLGSTIGSVFESVTYASIPGGMSALIFGAEAAPDFGDAYARMVQAGMPAQLATPMRSLARTAVAMRQGGAPFTDDRSDAELLQMDAISAAMGGVY